MQDFLVHGRDDLIRARQAWLQGLARERRLAPLTVEAYGRDILRVLENEAR